MQYLRKQVSTWTVHLSTLLRPFYAPCVLFTFPLPPLPSPCLPVFSLSPAQHNTSSRDVTGEAYMLLCSCPLYLQHPPTTCKCNPQISISCCLSHYKTSRSQTPLPSHYLLPISSDPPSDIVSSVMVKKISHSHQSNLGELQTSP